MGFGMCGATSKGQTPQQALDDLSPLRPLTREAKKVEPRREGDPALCCSAPAAPVEEASPEMSICTEVRAR